MDNVLLQERFDQLKQPALTHALLHPRHQPRVRNRVEVTLKISIHHLGVTVLEIPVHFPQSVLAAAPRSKSIARVPKLTLEDRFHHQLHRRLHDAVLDRRNPQRAKLTRPFGNLHALHRLRLIRPALQRLPQFIEIRFRSGRKPLDTLPVHPRRTRVVSHLAPRRLQRRRAIDLVDQAKPFAAFDAVIQRRQHALVPHRGFHPRPITAARVCTLYSHLWHCRCFAHALPRFGLHASTFLPPVPRRGFALRASRAGGVSVRRGMLPSSRIRVSSPLAMTLLSTSRYHEGSDSCPRSLRAQVSPLNAPYLPAVPSPTTWCAWSSLYPPPQRDRLLPDFAMNEQARRSTPPKQVRYPTDRQFASGCSPPRLTTDAVTFSYGDVAHSGTDFHRADIAPSRAHSFW